MDTSTRSGLGIRLPSSVLRQMLVSAKQKLRGLFCLWECLLKV